MSLGFPLATSVQYIQVKSVLPVLSVQYAQHLVWADIPPGLALTRPCWPRYSFWPIIIYPFFLFLMLSSALEESPGRSRVIPITQWPTDSWLLYSWEQLQGVLPLLPLVLSFHYCVNVFLSTKTPLSSPPAFEGPLLILHCMADALQFHWQWMVLFVHCFSCM